MEFTLSQSDWRIVAVFLLLVLFSEGFRMFGGGR